MWLPMRPHRPEAEAIGIVTRQGQDRLRAWAPKALEPGRASGSPTIACKRRRGIFVESLRIPKHATGPHSGRAR